MTTDNLTAHRMTIRALAQYVANNGPHVMAYNLLRTYALAAGVTQDGGGWVRFLPTAYRQRGWFNFAKSLAASDDTDVTEYRNRYVVVQAMATAHAAGAAAMGEPVASSSAPRMATVDDLNEVAKRITDLASQLASVPPVSSADIIVIEDDADLARLTAVQSKLVGRIVKRAVHEMGKTILDVLDGWIDETEMTAPTFSANSIRGMVNDACRVMGAPEAYRADV